MEKHGGLLGFFVCLFYYARRFIMKDDIKINQPFRIIMFFSDQCE